MSITKIEPAENGDCGEKAVDVLIVLASDSSTRLCHGYPTGQGEIEGIKHWHAWVELNAVLPEKYIEVIDVSNGNNVRMPRDLYYQIGQIDPQEVRRFTRAEAVEQLVEHKDYGPWHV